MAGPTTAVDAQAALLLEGAHGLVEGLVEHGRVGVRAAGREQSEPVEPVSDLDDGVAPVSEPEDGRCGADVGHGISLGLRAGWSGWAGAGGGQPRRCTPPGRRVKRGCRQSGTAPFEQTQPGCQWFPGPGRPCRRGVTQRGRPPDPGDRPRQHVDVSGDEVAELVEQRGLRLGADDLLHDLAVLVDVQRRDAGDAVGRRGDRVLVDVQLDEARSCRRARRRSRRGSGRPGGTGRTTRPRSRPARACRT